MAQDDDRAPATTNAGAGRFPMKEPDFPNLTAMNAYDRQAHIERGLAAGLTREQAEKHADEHRPERSPRQVEDGERPVDD